MKALSPYLRLITALFSAFLFLLPAKSPAHTPPEKGIWYELEMTGDMNTHLSTLETDEKWEQCRDWIVFAYIHSLSLDEKTAFEYLYDFAPLRYEMLHPVSSLQYGEGRYLAMKNGELVVLVPVKSPQRRNLICRMADENRQLNGKRPASIRVVDYQIDPTTFQAKFQYSEDISTDVLYSKKYGYIEQKIANRNDLSSFLATVDDVVFAQKTGDGNNMFGGRIYENFNGKSVQLEDVAALYQADLRLADSYVERLGYRGLISEYKYHKRHISDWLGDESVEEYIAIVQNLKDSLEELQLRQSQAQKEGWLELYNANGADLKKQIEIGEDNIAAANAASSYEAYKAYFKGYYVQPDDLNIGFSLDPDVKYNDFAEALRRIANGDRDFALQWYNDWQRPSDEEAILFDLKRFNEPFPDSSIEKKEENVLDLLRVREHSIRSLLSGQDSVETETSIGKKDLIDLLEDYFNIPEAALQDQTDEMFEEIWKISQRYKQLLINIADQIKSATTEGQRLALYRQMRRYIEDDMLLQLSGKKGISGEDWEESYVNQLIFNDVVEILTYHYYLSEKEYRTFDKEVTAAVAAFQQDYGLKPTGIVDNKTMQILLKSYPAKHDELARLNKFLRNLKTTYSYQKARYDGDLQGTEVGMTLFYTDLLMKLWNFNYKKSSPGQFVLGFTPETEYPVSLVHHRDIDKNSSTRSWLGPLQSSYDIYGNGSELYFSHCATTIYNASSNDLFPGFETDANVSSERFANWWNNHFSEVADYEPEYHRLNQIMKWTVLVKWFKLNDRFSWLNQETGINRHLDFEKWYARNSTLTTKVAIPFLDKNALREKTECMDILQSEPFSGFKEAFLVYHFYGGVSLPTTGQVLGKTRTIKDPAIFKTGFTRKNINPDLSKSLSNITRYDGSKCELLLSKRTAIIKPKQSAKFRGKDGQAFGLKLERNVNARNGKTTVREQSGDDFLGEITAEIKPGKVKLAAKESDIETYRRFLSEASQTDTPERSIFRSDEVDFAAYITEENSYLVRLKGNNRYLLLKKEEVPVGPYVLSVDNPAYQLRFSAGKENYLTGYIRSEQEVAQIFKRYGWKKVSGNPYASTMELTSEAPLKTNDNVVYFFNERNVSEAIFHNGNVFLKNQYPADDAVSAYLKDSGTGFLSRLKGDNAEGCIFTKSGQRIAFSPKKNSAIQQEIDALFPKGNLSLRGVVTSDYITTIRIRWDGIIEIPRPNRLTVEQKNVIRFVNEKTRENSKWLDILRMTDDIKNSDVTQLAKLTDGNLSLGRGFYNAKRLGELPQGMAFADFRSAGKQLQMVVKNSYRDPIIVDLGFHLETPLESVAGRVNKLYSGEASINSQEELLEITRPFAELQKAVIRQSPGVRKIVTVEFDGINSEVINKLHGVSNEVRFYKDQPDPVRSVENASAETTLEFEGAIFLTTTELVSDSDQNVAGLHADILRSGVETENNLTTARFKDILEDSTYHQIVLVVRANEKGLVFSDRTMSYYELDEELYWYATDKEAIYLVTNRRSELENQFAGSGRFRKVISDQYQLGQPETFKSALGNVRYFYDSFAKDAFALKNRDYKKMMKQNPGLKEALFGRVQSQGKNVVIEVGKLGRQQKRNIPVRVWEFFNEKMNRNKYYEPKTIEKVLDDRQRMKIEQLKSEPNPLRILKSIPYLKVWNGKLDTQNLA